MKEMTGSVGLQDVVTCTASGWDFSVNNATGYSLTLNSGDTIAAASVGVFQMEFDLVDPGDASTEQLTFVNCRGSVQFAEGMPSKFTITGVCYMTVDRFMSSIA